MPKPYPEPTYLNSAGRLLAVLSKFNTNQGFAVQLAEYAPHLDDSVLSTRNKARGDVAQVRRAEVVLTDLRALHQDMLDELREVNMEEAERAIMIDALSGLYEVLYPSQLEGPARVLNGAEENMLRLVARRIPQENQLPESDVNLIHRSLADVEALLADSELTPSTKRLLRELVGTTQAALSIHNIRGPKALMKSANGMLGELTALYLVDKSIRQQRWYSTAMQLALNVMSVASRALMSRAIEYAVPEVIDQITAAIGQ